MAEFPTGIAKPELVSFIAGSGVALSFDNLTPRELDIFDRDLVKLAKYFGLQRELAEVFLEDRDAYLYAAAIAKKQLGVGFGGCVPGSGQFGMQMIRPKLILGADTWFQTYTALGWGNILGSSGSPVDFSSTSATYGNPQNRVIAVFPKLVDYCIPKIGEMWMHIGPSDYPIWPIRFMQLSDLYVANLPATALIVKNGKFYMRGNVEALNVVDGMAPLGLTFALAEFMTGSGQE